MNRRNFLNSLAIGVACLALRIKPDAAKELPTITGFTLEHYNEILERIYRVTAPGPEWIFCSPSTAKQLREIYARMDRVP